MAHLTIRPDLIRLFTGIAVAALGVVAGPVARADTTAYLVNITVRPGYHFPDADAALSYGSSVCDKVSHGRTYAQVMGDIKDDFGTTDEYQASYLINQAVNELCPAFIWQLRKSAANYRPPTQP